MLQVTCPGLLARTQTQSQGWNPGLWHASQDKKARGTAGETPLPRPPIWGACPLMSGHHGSGWQRQTDAFTWLSSLQAPSPGRFWKGDGAVPGLPHPRELLETGPPPSLDHPGCFCSCHPSAGTPEGSLQRPGRQREERTEGSRELGGWYPWASRGGAVPLPHTIRPHSHSAASEESCCGPRPRFRHG